MCDAKGKIAHSQLVRGVDGLGAWVQMLHLFFVAVRPVFVHCPFKPLGSFHGRLDCMEESLAAAEATLRSYGKSLEM